MGIKVLLADDSAAIKKVVQLCLQDFGVELKSLGNGKEVLDLAKQFKPDIALIDVMLPHKPGFEVAMEIKKDPSLKATPIIMLWSNFMEFDEAKFKMCGAEAKLEKPFDAKELREMVNKLVPKTQSQGISQYIQLPKLDFKIPSPDSQTNISKVNPNTNTGTVSSTFSQTNIEMPPLSITNSTKSLQDLKDESESSEWVRKDLGKFKVNIDSDGFEDNAVPFQYDESQLENSAIMKAKVGTGHGHAPEAPAAAPVLPKIDLPPPAATQAAPAAPNLDNTQVKTMLEKQIAEIVQKEMREILEKTIWKIVPDIATQIIKEEIQRLTSES